MEETSTDIDTEMLDLTDVALDHLATTDPDEWQPALDHIKHQVTHPRANIGQTGPPGRVD